MIRFLNHKPMLTLRNLLVLVLAAGSLGACDDGDTDIDAEPVIGDPDYPRDPALDIELISQNGDAISHETGRNCMACHQAFGPGPGQFTVAGTLYRNRSDQEVLGDGVLEFRDAPGGEVVLRVEVDSLGNFYSTEPLPLPDMVLFPIVYAPNDDVGRAMPFPTRSGACNVCHAGARVVSVEG